MDLPPETRYADYGDKKIAYQKTGIGNRRIVLINGAAGHLELIWTDPAFADSLEHLASAAELLVFEQLGFGMSDPLDHLPSIEEQAQEIAAVMDAAGWESASIAAIWTPSMAVAVFAAMHPERVEHLVLLTPFAQGWGASEDLMGWTREERLEFDAEWDEVLKEWGTGRSLQAFSPAVATPRTMRRWGVLERISASPAVMQGLYQRFRAADAREAMAAIQAPTLVVNLASTRLPEAAVRYVAELIPHAEYIVLPATTDNSFLWRSFTHEVERFVLGSAPRPEARRSLKTVLFTDIVASTEQAALLGDTAWRQVLSDHERLLRRHVDDADGRVVKLIGDGSLCAFDSPARAIRCAERVCAAGPRELDLEIRAGLHTGECEITGDDLAGIAVHIAARVSAKAGPGEVLVSRTVRDLVVGSGVVLSSRGEYELKGVDGAWELFALDGGTAPASAPDQTRSLRAGDKVALAGARRAPGLLRAASRLSSRGRRSP